MGLIHGATSLVLKKTHPVYLADVLRDGGFALPWRSLEDHVRLSL